eukprot:GHVP01056932.1.p1 GENE.GHVP01056932.1~~GHVP01056932.1.p1  ORF type:complete len:277 (-),score=37.51 GHVP01056932.1:41-844(-)
MEFKLLSDQLNSACEDFPGIPQTNEFLLQDDLHGNLEPEFRWIRWRKSILKAEKAKGNYYSEPTTRVKCIMNRLRTVCTLKRGERQKYEVEFIGRKCDLAKLPDKYKDEFITTIDFDDATALYIQEPQVKDGRRSYTIQNDLENLHTVQCTSEDCFKFSITSRRFRKKIDKDATFFLWWAFECCPDLSIKTVKFVVDEATYSLPISQVFLEGRNDYAKDKFDPVCNDPFHGLLPVSDTPSNSDTSSIEGKRHLCSQNDFEEKRQRLG